MIYLLKVVFDICDLWNAMNPCIRAVKYDENRFGFFAMGREYFYLN